jgi:hypothetical protein
MEVSMPEESLTPDEFCAAEKICRATLYNLWRRGKGPRYHLVGNKRRISAQARAEWQRDQEGNGGAHASAGLGPQNKNHGASDKSLDSETSRRHQVLRAKLAIARKRRNEWLDDLELLADWLDELRENPTEEGVRAWLMASRAFVARRKRGRAA